ncbi:MAG: EF-P beta-lysylation protein EpmB [Planctomycetota bacterium]
MPIWQAEMRDAIRDLGELRRALDLPNDPSLGARAAADQFSVFVPRPFLRRMRPASPRDPLLLQVLPTRQEEELRAGFVADPVGDEAAQKAPGLLQKYAGRALLTATGVCAVHCRYCFRRHYPYGEVPRREEAWNPALDVLQADASIHEVILSGGDPLTLTDRRLRVLADRIAAIPHVRRLRIHTRLPVMIPSRVAGELLAWLTGGRLTPIVVIHANHAQEIDNEVGAAIDLLRRAGATLLNQAVLLRDVNDSVEAQCSLSERLVEVGVTPYYLHQLDRVQGAAHFETTERQGRSIIEQMQRRLSGYMVPRYVRETPGESQKSALL